MPDMDLAWPTPAAVDVVIVSEPWTNDLLAGIAIALSLATLAWTLWARRTDQARLKVESAISVPLGTPGPAVRLIGVDVTNVGRQGSTVLQNITLRHGRSGGNLVIFRPAHGIAPEYPATLAPGETAKLLIDPRGVAQSCAENGIAVEKLFVAVSTGHGVKFARLSKNCRWLINDVA